MSRRARSPLLDPRARIVDTFARWTALSALRSGAPIRSRKAVYGAMAHLKFEPLFDAPRGPIDRTEFDGWHHRSIDRLMHVENNLNVGWAAKILNVYLKTRCYVGGEGRPGLADVIHPPIDGGLWLGLKRQFEDRPEILDRSNCVTKIKDIESHDCYEKIIDGCRLAAAALGCRLIEIEQLWDTGQADGDRQAGC